MILFSSHQLFDLIKPYLPASPIILEAGAFDGQDTRRLATALPTATIHAFEPVPELFKRLETNTKDLPHVRRYPIALSNTTGTARFYVSEKPARPGIPSQAGSLFAPKERLAYSPIHFPYTIEVPTITLDEWALHHNIDHIDMLWLDMQGPELSVLKASSTILPTVSLIFTEVSFIESYANQPRYPEVCTWLEAQGFYLLGTDFQEPPSHFFGNALFVRRSLVHSCG